MDLAPVVGGEEEDWTRVCDCNGLCGHGRGLWTQTSSEHGTAPSGRQLVLIIPVHLRQKRQRVCEKTLLKFPLAEQVEKELRRVR